VLLKKLPPQENNGTAGIVSQQMSKNNQNRLLRVWKLMEWRSRAGFAVRDPADFPGRAAAQRRRFTNFPPKTLP